MRTSNYHPYFGGGLDRSTQPQALPRLHPHHRQQITAGAVGGDPGDRVLVSSVA
jgi:hypothetical protein